MDQEKIGKLIKDIRRNHNLTQKELASKLGVTYQAVSKWENGKNIPDIGILKEISKEFDIDIAEILDGEIKTFKKKNTTLVIYLIIIVLIIALISLTILIKSNNNSEFKFKTMSSNCHDFKLTGSAAYNRAKTAIYISNVEFCGREDKVTYKKIECTLYEKHTKEKIKVSSCTSKKNIKLDDYLKEVNINVSNYSTKCKELTSNDLSLEIVATKADGKKVSYNVPIKLNEHCK